MNSRILPIFALVAAIAIFFGYVNPQWNGAIASTKASIVSDNQALTAASDYVARKNELASKRNAIDPTDLARLKTFLPDSVDNVGMILDLNALAARSGLSLSNVDVSAGPKTGSTGLGTKVGEGPVGSVELSLSALGTYDSFKRFLSGVENSTRLLDVRDLTISGSNTSVYTYKMSIRLYWLR